MKTLIYDGYNMMAAAKMINSSVPIRGLFVFGQNKHNKSMWIKLGWSTYILYVGDVIKIKYPCLYINKSVYNPNAEIEAWSISKIITRNFYSKSWELDFYGQYKEVYDYSQRFLERQ